jgi:nucleoside-diphosphate-sugar epimerase
MNTPTIERGLVLVTGGSGYIAGYCIAQLLSEGWRVRTTVRNLSKADDVRSSIGQIAANASELEFVTADLNADSGWAEAVGGATYVMHVASPVPAVAPKTDDELVRPARDGTLRVLNKKKGMSGLFRIFPIGSLSSVIVNSSVIFVLPFVSVSVRRGSRRTSSFSSPELPLARLDVFFELRPELRRFDEAFFPVAL